MWPLVPELNTVWMAVASRRASQSSIDITPATSTFHGTVEYLAQPAIHGAVVVVVQVFLRIRLEDVVGGHHLGDDLPGGGVVGHFGLIGEPAIDRNVVVVVPMVGADCREA